MAQTNNEPFHLYTRNRSPYWYVHFNQGGKRCSSGRTDREEAQEWAWEQVKGRKRPSRRPPSLREFSEDFFLVDRCPIIKRLRSKGKQFGDVNAKDRRGFLVNHIWAQFGQRQLDSIEAGEIEDWLIDLSLSNHSKNQLLTTLTYVVKEARRDGHLERLPTEGIERFAPHHAQRPAFTEEQVTQLFDGAIETWKSHWYRDEIAIAAFLAAHTGMRLGEIPGLQWNHVDFDEDLLYVEQRADNARNAIGPPKSGKPRPVPITAKLKYALLYLKNCQQPDTTAFLFSETGSAPFYTNVFYRGMSQALEKLGLDGHSTGYGFHSFRRYYVTALRNAGVPESTIGLIVDHENSAVTDIYDRRTLRDLAKSYKDSTAQIARAVSAQEIGKEVSA